MKKRLASIVLMVAACVLCAITAGAQSRASLLFGLTAYYQFDGNGMDSSGNGLDLTLFGNPTFAPGLFGQALDLHRNGGQYAQRMVDDAVFSFGPDDFTIQLWIYLYSAYDVEQTFIEKFDGETGPGWTITKPVFPYSLQAYANNAAIKINAAPALSTCVWHQLVVRRTGDRIDFFYDSSLVGTAVSRAAFTHTTNGLLVGKRNNNDGRDFSMNGRIDEIGIWHRALREAELEELYNAGKGRKLEARLELRPVSITHSGSRLTPVKPTPSVVPLTTTAPFSLQIKPVSSQPNQMSLSFGPVSGSLEDNNYHVFYSTDLLAGAWWPLSDVVQSRIGQQQTVIDLDATQPSKYYRVVWLP